MKRIVLASGGLDSSTLLAILPKEDTVALFFDYGQLCAEQERKAIRGITNRLGISLVERNIADVFRSSKSNIIRQEPTKSNEKQHEVECRNLVFVALATSIATQLFPKEQVEILLGIIKIGFPYPDCTVDFIKQCNSLVQMVSNGCVQIIAPFADIGKDEVLMRLNGSDILPKETWSCYYGQDEPCGECPACIDRKILGV